MPTVSVVIATYNRAALLRATLDRLREQDYLPGDEVIVVDNGSTDATGAVIVQAAATFPVPLVGLVESTPGKSPALNAGVARAHGAILALTDDDVLVASDWIATIRKIFSESPVALVGGRVDPNWERPAPSWLRFEENGQYGPMSSPLALLHYGETQELGTRTALGANMAIRASVLASLGGFAPHLGRRRGTLLCGEDHDLCQRAVASGLRCEYRPELRVQPLGSRRAREFPLLLALVLLVRHHASTDVGTTGRSAFLGSAPQEPHDGSTLSGRRPSHGRRKLVL